MATPGITPNCTVKPHTYPNGQTANSLVCTSDDGVFSSESARPLPAGASCEIKPFDFKNGKPPVQSLVCTTTNDGLESESARPLDLNG